MSVDRAPEAVEDADERRRTGRRKKLSDLARPRLRNRSAILVAVAVGVALFVLVAAAFSVAAESRVVATRSNQLHSYDELLRNSITVRSQLGSALNFAQLDASQGTDSGAVIEQSLGEARTALADLADSGDTVRADAALPDALDAYGRSARTVADLVETRDRDNLAAARDLLVGPMSDEYVTLVDALVAERERLVDALVEADRNLGRLGTMATFIIAFFVPTVAMFVYFQITRRQRETIELARLLSDFRQANDWRSDLVRLAADLTEAEMAALPASPRLTSLMGRLRDLEFLVGASSLGHGYTFGVCTVDEIRDAVTTQWPDLVVRAGEGSDLLWADRDAVTQLLGDVARNAHRRGAQRVLISGGSESGAVWLTMTDNGTAIDPNLVSSVLDTASLIDATTAIEHAPDNDADTVLLLMLGRMIAPALGGTFSCETLGTNVRFSLRVPVARTRRSAPVAAAVR